MHETCRLFLPELGRCGLWHSQEAEAVVGRDPSGSLASVPPLQPQTLLCSPLSFSFFWPESSGCVGDKYLRFPEGELQPHPRCWALCVKIAWKGDGSAMPQWELHRRGAGSSGCSSLTRPATAPSPWEPWESPRGCHAIQHRCGTDRRFENPA